MSPTVKPTLIIFVIVCIAGGARADERGSAESSSGRFRIVRTFEAADFAPGRVAVLPSQNVVLATRQDEMPNSFVAWDMKSGVELHREGGTGRREFFPKLDFSTLPDESWFALPCLRADRVAGVRITSARDGRTLRELKDADSQICSRLILRNNGRVLIGGCDDGNVRVWDTQTGKVTQTLSGHTNSVIELAVDESSGTLASQDIDGLLCLWSLKTLRLTKSSVILAEGFPALTAWMVFVDRGRSLLGSLAAYVQKSSTVLIDVETLTVRESIPWTTTLVHQQTSDARGKTVVVGTAIEQNRCLVRIQGFGDGARVRDLPAVSQVIVGAAISPDGKTIAAISFSNLNVKREDGRLEYSIDKKAEIVDCQIHIYSGNEFSERSLLSVTCRRTNRSEAPLDGLRFSQDGKFLAAATGSSVVLIELADSAKRE